MKEKDFKIEHRPISEDKTKLAVQKVFIELGFEPLGKEVNKIFDAIEKVPTLEESKNDFCEWKFEETTGIVWHCNDECTTYNLPYSQNLKIVLEDFECKCPHCGKKIKVAN